MNFPNIFDVLQTFLILGRVEDLVKLLLDLASLLQRPVAVLLVAEDDVVEDWPRHAKTVEHLLVDVRTFGTELSGSCICSMDLGCDRAVQGLDRYVLQLL